MTGYLRMVACNTHVDLRDVVQENERISDCSSKFVRFQAPAMTTGCPLRTWRVVSRTLYFPYHSM